jgi:parallel beta-helix repeat protein
MSFFLFVSLLVFSHAPFVSADDFVIKTVDDIKRLNQNPKMIQPGQKVIISKGNYPVGFEIAGLHGSPDKPIIITGESDSIKVLDNGANLNSLPTVAGMMLQSSSYVRIENLHFSGGSRGITLGACDNVTVNNMYISDITNYGVMNYLSSNTKITNNFIKNSSMEHGIYLSGAGSNVVVRGNRIVNTHINGIHCNGKLTNITLQDNQLTNIGTYPDKEGGAAITLIGGVSGALVENNVFKNIYGQGITIDGSNITITKNDFEEYAWSGVLIVGAAHDVRIVSNKFLDKKVVPFNFAESAFPTLTSKGNTFGVSSGIICLKMLAGQKTEVKLDSRQWKDLGFD